MSDVLKPIDRRQMDDLRAIRDALDTQIMLSRTSRAGQPGADRIRSQLGVARRAVSDAMDVILEPYEAAPDPPRVVRAQEKCLERDRGIGALCILPKNHDGPHDWPSLRRAR